MDSFFTTPISQIMVTKVITINMNDQFSKVEELLRLHGIRHLPVVDDHNVMRGIITQRDLYRIISPMRNEEGSSFYNKDILNEYILKYVMTKEVVTLSPQETLGAVISLMVKTKYGCIPVLDAEKHLLGIVTQVDVLRAIAKHIE